VKGYHDVRRYPDAKQIPGLLLFRWDAPLFFANADMFRERILDAIEAARTPVRWVVVAAEPITDVDTTAAEMLEEFETDSSAMAYGSASVTSSSFRPSGARSKRSSTATTSSGRTGKTRDTSDVARPSLSPSLSPRAIRGIRHHHPSQVLRSFLQRVVVFSSPPGARSMIASSQVSSISHSLLDLLFGPLVA
jgi:MFS superfamily sulfate permease-like transporter